MKFTFKEVVVFILFFLFAHSSAFSQTIKFNKVRAPQDQISGLVTGITQDAQGYMWISSTSGLLRYDGYQVTTYRHDPANQNSVGVDRLECLQADTNDIIWVGTFGTGLDRFDVTSEHFTHFRHDPKNPKSISSDTVFALKKDHEGTLWVGTAIGLDKFDPLTGTFTHFIHNNDDPASLSNNQVRAIYEDRQGTLWIGTGSPFPGETPGDEGGLNRLNRKTGRFTRYMHDDKDPHSLVNNKVRAIFEDSRGTFWVGTAGDGLHTMDRNTGIFQRYPYDPLHPDKLSRPPLNKNITYDHISFITEDALGAIWIGTNISGINRYDPVRKKVTHYDDRDSALGLIDGTSWVAYNSREGVLWISSFGSSIYTIDPYYAKIQHYNLGQPVFTFYEDKDHALWIGTLAGLLRKDQVTGMVESFINNTIDHGSLGNNRIYSITKDADDNLWMNTLGNGLHMYNPKTKVFTSYHHDSKNDNSLFNDSVYTVYADNQQHLFIGTLNELDIMNLKTGKFTHYFFDKKRFNAFGFTGIWDIFQDNTGHFWIGTGTGLIIMDITSGKFKRFLENVPIYGILQDSANTIWVASRQGLTRFDPVSNSFKLITNPSTGKQFQVAWSITQDEHKNIWLATSAGIVKYNEIKNESTTYGLETGVNGKSLNNFAAYKDQNGHLYFGDLNGYFAFSPEELLRHSTPPEIVIGEFAINNKIVYPGNSSALQQPLWKTKEISLSHDQNVFSFGFAGINYSNPYLNKHLYKLENYDNDWRVASNEHIAYYFNVPPGKYIFKVKASNNAGIWAEKDITIIIHPPWWQTWWAYTIFAIAFVFAIWGFVYYRSRNLLKEKRVLEHKVNVRTAEVMQQKEEIALQRDNLEQTLNNLKTTQSQLIQSEKMASLGELTAGIAHEIQNPLNFVNNFAEVNLELIEELKSEKSKVKSERDEQLEDELLNNIAENEQKIIHHGKRADAIVKGMLQHSRSSNSIKEPTDINALADEYLRLAYHGLRAKDKSFNATLKTDFDETIGNINIIPQDIGRVLLNLYNNAFYALGEKKKQTGNNYEPLISVSTKKINGKVEICIKDNGNGIPQKIIDKIFQPFFTTKPTGQGTGLGLSLSYDIIKAHGGEIKVETKDGEGSEFIIKLLIA